MENKNIIFEYDNVTASEALENFTKEKLNVIFDRYDFVHRADVFFKTENTTSDETGMKSGIRLSAPGPRLFAESSHSTFKESVVETIDELTRQLKKRKEKMKSY